MGTCLLDLLPDALEHVRMGYKTMTLLINDDDFPLVEFLVAIGFFIVLILDGVTHYIREKGSSIGENADLHSLIGHGHSHGPSAPVVEESGV